MTRPYKNAQAHSAERQAFARQHRSCRSQFRMSCGLDVDCDPAAPVFKPRCCIKLHKSVSLNLSAKRPSRTRLRFSIFTSELSFFASCFILSRLSRKRTILAMTPSFPGLPLFFPRLTCGSAGFGMAAFESPVGSRRPWSASFECPGRSGKPFPGSSVVPDGCRCCSASVSAPSALHEAMATVGKLTVCKHLLCRPLEMKSRPLTCWTYYHDCYVEAKQLTTNVKEVQFFAAVLV